MDAGAVASVAGILDNDAYGGRAAGLEEWCMSAMYAMSRGSLWFCGLTRAGGRTETPERVPAAAQRDLPWRREKEGGGERKKKA